jgi:hypothetical protein
MSNLYKRKFRGKLSKTIIKRGEIFYVCIYNTMGKEKRKAFFAHQQFNKKIERERKCKQLEEEQRRRQEEEEVAQHQQQEEEEAA